MAGSHSLVGRSLLEKRMSNVLVVEDDGQTLAEIVEALTDPGCNVETASTGRGGLMLAVANSYDAIVLDRMLPGGLEGLGMLAALRSAGVLTPVLILSALSAVDERVRGLRAGGDDYLTKPFEFIELTARLDALMRRREAAPGVQEYQVGPLRLDPLKREVSCAGRPVPLLPREYRLLEYLMHHEGQRVTRTLLFEPAWDHRRDTRA